MSSAFDDPADLAQAGAMGDAAAGDAWGDTAFAEQAAVLVEVVAAVGEELAGLAPGPAAPAADRRNRVEQRKQWVTSWRFPPVRVTASGIPWASTIR